MMRNSIVFTCLIAAILVIGCREKVTETEREINKVPTEPLKVFHYGLRTDTALYVEGEIQKNQFFSDLLNEYKIGYSKIDQLIKNTQDVFNPKRLRVGKKYAFVCDKDSTAKYFVYQPNQIDYIIFNLEDSLFATSHQKEITTVTKEASGFINSSLSITMEEQGLNHSLASEIADIYAWTIDFYRIQKGDFFKVIYEEQFVEGKSIGIEKVKACVFNHFGEDNFAFFFDGDSASTGYYDEEAKSLQKVFLKAPLKFNRISSHFSLRRFHPVQKRYKAHFGTDYAAPTGTPIWSTADGIVSRAGYTSGNGNFVKIKHNNTYSTQYLHMSKIASGIKVGKAVKQREIIGYVGSTGLATGPHVCYRFWKNGNQVNPFAEKFPPAKPIKEEFKPIFDSLSAQLELKLSSIEMMVLDSV